MKFPPRLFLIWLGLFLGWIVGLSVLDAAEPNVGKNLEPVPAPKVLIVDLDWLLERWALFKIDRIDQVGQRYIQDYKVLLEQAPRVSDPAEKKAIEDRAQAKLRQLDALKILVKAIAARGIAHEKQAPECLEVLAAIEAYKRKFGYDAVYATTNKFKLNIPKAGRRTHGDKRSQQILDSLEKTS